MSAGRPGRTAWRAVLAGGALALAGCASTPSVIVAQPPPGLAQRPYTALPWYLMPPSPPPLPPAGRVGRYSACVPVADTAWYPSADRLERLRLALARVDTVLVGLRQPATQATQPATTTNAQEAADCEPTPPTPEELQRLAVEVRTLVDVRPDLRAEADELAWLAGQLSGASSLRREQILDRAGELTDLIRIQLAAS